MPFLMTPPPSSPLFDSANSVACHFVTKSIVKVPLPHVVVVTGPPQADIKGVVILAALLTSIGH